MASHDEFILVSPATKAGERFMELLKIRKLPYAAIINSARERARLVQLGVKHIIEVDTKDHESWIIPKLPIGKVYLFERSLPLCCRYIQICRSWTGQSVYIITEGQNARKIYRGLGADYVVYSNNSEVSFLIHDEQN